MLIEFYKDNAGSYTQILEMIKGGKGTPNDVFTVDTKVKDSPDDEDFIKVIPAGTTLLQAIILLDARYCDPACPPENISKDTFYAAIEGLYSLGAARDNRLTLEYSLKSFKLFCLATSLTDINKIAVLYIQYCYEYSYNLAAQQQNKSIYARPSGIMDANCFFFDFDKYNFDVLNILNILNSLNQEIRFWFIKESCFQIQRNYGISNALITYSRQLLTTQQISELKKLCVKVGCCAEMTASLGMKPREYFQEAMRCIMASSLLYNELDYHNIFWHSVYRTANIEYSKDLFSINTDTQLANLIFMYLTVCDNDAIPPNARAVNLKNTILDQITSCPLFERLKENSLRIALFKIIIQHNVPINSHKVAEILKYLAANEKILLMNLVLYNRKFAVGFMQLITKVNKLRFTAIINNADTNILAFNNWVMYAADSVWFNFINNLPAHLSIAKFAQPEHSFADKGKFANILGRTILLDLSDGTFCALKILKKDEPVSQLSKQFHTDRYFEQKRVEYNLLGELPRDGKMVKIQNITEFLLKLGIPVEQQISLLHRIAYDDNSATIAYTFIASKEYFRYLSSAELNTAMFLKAAITAVNDILNLMDGGVMFHQLADLYHDTDRPYIAVGAETLGKLAQWQDAVRYPNLRQSTGLADSGDICGFSDYDAGVDASKENMNIATTAKIHEYIGRLLLIINLCGASGVLERCKSQDLPQSERDKLWQDLSLALKYIHQFCFNKVNELLAIKLPVHLFKNACNHYELLAKQMSFWCDPSRHWQFLSKFSIPAQMYPPECETDIEHGMPDLESRLLNNEIEEVAGINGNAVKGQHLGFENGLFPLDVRAHYLVTALPTFLAPLKVQVQEQRLIFSNFNKSRRTSDSSPATEIIHAAACQIQQWWRCKKYM